MSTVGKPSAMPAELAAVRAALWQEVVRLHMKWKIFSELYGSKETVDLLNFGAQAYFGLSQHVWADHIQLAIARLTDPLKSVGKDNLSLSRLLVHIDPADPAGLRDRVKVQLDELETLCGPIRQRRSKLLAHSDLDTILGRSLVPLVPITKKTIDSAFEKIRGIMNEVERAYLDRTTLFEYAVDTDAQELLYCLRHAREYRRQQRIRSGLPADPESQNEA
ncbi:MAG TPA: hypothetical protein VGR67_12185 [Candidatus Polarisedimenticolia bacterium]|nr:hypothetical protein [Candidatus Polarisedimenticolia bacterium]